jgi:hypothetical protein
MTDERMRRRALIGTVVLAVIAAGVTVVALASRSSAPSGQRPSSASASPPAPSATARPSPCTPARVHYAGPPAAAHALDEGLIPENVPWIASPDSAVYGFLFFQEAPEFERLYSRRPRVATIPTNGQVTDGVNVKILWWLRDAGQSDDLVVLVGRRIDAAGQFEQELGTSSVLPSIVDIPTAGCWTLTIRRGAASWNLRVKAIDSR